MQHIKGDDMRTYQRNSKPQPNRETDSSESRSNRPEWLDKIGPFMGLLFVAVAFVAYEQPELLTTGQISTFFGYVLCALFMVGLIFGIGYASGITATDYSAGGKEPTAWVVVVRCLIITAVFVFILYKLS